MYAGSATSQLRSLKPEHPGVRRTSEQGLIFNGVRRSSGLAEIQAAYGRTNPFQPSRGPSLPGDPVPTSDPVGKKLGVQAAGWGGRGLLEQDAQAVGEVGRWRRVLVPVPEREVPGLSRHDGDTATRLGRVEEIHEDTDLTVRPACGDQACIAADLACEAEGTLGTPGGPF